MTFNQDIQIEKALHAIAGTKTRLGQRTFAFPGCYRLAFKGGLTAPRRNRGALFGSDRDFFGVSLLKLHDSLNWYSAHNTPNPSKRAIFDPRRTIGITRRQAIDTGMLLTTLPKKAKFTFPIVIPPVVNKAGILHHDLQAVWSEAEERLRVADRVIVFGIRARSTTGRARI